MTSALTAFAALLDQSLEDMSAAWADTQSFDRSAVSRTSDVWDNNTYPLFAAATARSRRRREQLAEDGLRWLADLGLERRDWAIEQTARAGYTLEMSLTPRGHRDYAGMVRPRSMPVTSSSVVELETDYDLAGVEVRKISIERSKGQLNGNAHFIGLGRRFDTGEGADSPAELWVTFEAVDDVNFDSDDLPGLAIGAGTGVSTVIGEGGVVRAARAEMSIDDHLWHLSVAGRAVDLRTPPNPPRVVEAGRHGRTRTSTSQLVAYVLHWAMLEIRMVRNSAMVHQVPVGEFCRTFAGAGQDVLAAGTRRFGREAAFRRLLEQWIEAGGKQLGWWFRRELLSYAADKHQSYSAGLRRMAEELAGTIPDEPAKAEPTGLAADSSLLLVAYLDNRPHHHYTVVQAASGSGSGWQIQGRELDNPRRCAFSIADFDGPGSWRADLAGGFDDVGG